MKFTRQKYVRRLLNYYRQNFQVELPYRILIDGTFAFQALQWKIRIDEQLKSYLQTDQINFSTTCCAIRETELLGHVGFGAMLILKQYEIVSCHHFPSISAEKCFREILQKDRKTKYFLASQSSSLREFSHEHRPDLPTMLINHNSINLEKPSTISNLIVEEEKTEKLNLTKFEKKQIEQMKEELHLNDDKSKDEKKKKKKKKGVNPLSMKKKKLKKNLLKIEKPIKRKRRRTRQMRMSPHLKEFLRNLQKNFSIRDFLQMKSK